MFAQRPQTSELHSRRPVILFAPGHPATFAHGPITRIHTCRVSELIRHLYERHPYNLNEVRDLIGVLQREKAEIGVYISFAEPTAPMHREAAEAGFYTSADGSRYPRLQLLTIRGLIEGTQHIQRPLHVRDVTRPTAAQNLPLALTDAEPAG